MKRLYMIIAVAMLSIAASAQPTPTTFLDVQIAGGKETVAAQLIDAANKKIPAGAPLTKEYLYDNNSFEVKFYEGGDKKKEVAISVGMMDGQFYVYFRYNNKYNTSN